MEFIGQLILVLLMTTLLGQVFARFNWPPVIGQLLSGILLGSALLGWIHPNETMTLFSDIGVIMLMFLAGMESDLDLLKKYFKISFTVATVGVILPILFIGGASLLFGMQFLEALFIGIIFAATSVSISVEVLRATGMLQTKAGTAILGAAVVDDILAVIVLSLFTTFSHEGGKSGLTNNFFLNLLFEALYFVFVWLVYKFIAPKFMQLAEKINVSYSVVIASLILSLGMAYIAELVGLSAVVGAFFDELARARGGNALLDRRAEALTLLCSETRPDNQLYVRYRRYTLRHAVQETAAVPLPAEDTLPAAPGPFELLPDEAYNLQHRDFDLVSRNAGPFFLLGEQIIHPTQVSTTVDYGVYLQFLARRGSSEVPLCAATPQNVEITGLAPADIIGIHTYCRDDVLEIIDARYLTRLPKPEKSENPPPSAE